MTSEVSKATLYSDGGARGNPGPAGIGYVLRIDGREAILHGEYMGKVTNNQAEYAALLQGMERALKEGVNSLKCFLDSELVVEQLQGNYRVKNQRLKLLFARARELESRFNEVAYRHITREKNKEADKLVNRAIDERT